MIMATRLCLHAMAMVAWASSWVACGQNTNMSMTETWANMTTNLKVENGTTTPLVTTPAIMVKNGTVRVNVTLGGFRLNQTLRAPSRWGAAVAWEATVESTGDCPAGRWCPGGLGEPKVCKAGTYSPYTGRVSPCGDSEACHANKYCPDPGVMVSCPAHTWSGYRSTSPLDCRCQEGFQCVYSKKVNLNMILHVPLGVWLSESGKMMRAAVIKAVAESAGVNIQDVQIDQALPYMSTGAGSRRLLGNINNQDALLLRFTLHGAEKVGENALQTRISEILLPRRIRFPHHRTRTVGSVHWARADRVHVKPSKIWAKKSQW
jgi:hypothetical protein